MEEECALSLRHDSQHCVRMGYPHDAVVSGQTGVRKGVHSQMGLQLTSLVSLTENMRNTVYC